MRYTLRGLMSWRGSLLAALLLFTTLAVLSGPASAGSPQSGSRVAGDSSLEAFFSDTAGLLPACPDGYSLDCFQFVDHAAIRGLGYVTERHIVAVDSSSPSCTMVHVTPVVWSVKGKGKIEASLDVAPPCNGLPVSYTITGGTGPFKNVSGSGQFTPMFANTTGNLYNDILDMYWYEDEWNGTLVLPNFTPDTTPPVIRGAWSRVIRVTRGVRRIRVRFSVKARDKVDGRVPVKCTPRSGSFFKLGVTRVTCTASDSSANTKTQHFTITVKRAGE